MLIKKVCWVTLGCVVACGGTDDASSTDVGTGGTHQGGQGGAAGSQAGGAAGSHVGGAAGSQAGGAAGSASGGAAGAAGSTAGAAGSGGISSECHYADDPDLDGYYVSPTGSDSNPGTIGAPFATIKQALSVVSAGEAIWLRSGVFKPTEKTIISKSGAQNQPIRLWACAGEKPVIDFSALDNQSEGIKLTASYWHFRELEMRNLEQQDSGGLTIAVRAVNASHNIFERLDIHHNGGSSIHLSESNQGQSTDNLFLNCDFHHNYDSKTVGDPGENADGFAIAFISNTSSVNTVRGCRVWQNSDDGLDLWHNEGSVVIENSWAFDNGYIPGTPDKSSGNGNGFKLGETLLATDSEIRREVRNCLAFGNLQDGFDQNNAKTLMKLVNNTAYHNKATGFNFGWDHGEASELHNNLSFDNGANSHVIATTVHSHNSWNPGLTPSASDFESLVSTCASSPRKSDGSLPDCEFLRLSATSTMIDKGLDVGLPFLGVAPDLGSYEKK